MIPKTALVDAPPGSLYCPSFGKGTVTRRLGVIQRHVSSRSHVLASMHRALSERAREFGLEGPAPEPVAGT